MGIEEYETTWPIYRRLFTTPTSVPVSTVIATCPKDGDACLIPLLQIIGRSEDGFLGNAQLGGYTLLNQRGNAALRIARQDESNFGAGGLGIGLSLVGQNLVLAATGLDGTRVAWAIFWQVYDFPA